MFRRQSAGPRKKRAKTIENVKTEIMDTNIDEHLQPSNTLASIYNSNSDNNTLKLSVETVNQEEMANSVFSKDDRNFA